MVGTTHPAKNWPAERWIPVVDALAERHGARVLLLGGPSPEEGAIAVALGTPVVGLYGRTNPKLHGPWGPSRSHVADGFARTPGEPYGNLDRYRNEGMSRITPEMVLGPVDEALRAREGAGPGSANAG